MHGSDHNEDPWVHVKTKNGLPADEVISALQKEIRRGETENAALLAYEMVVTSRELEEMLWRRLKVISVEDIGFGDPMAPTLIDALARFVESPEQREGDRVLFAVHAVRYLCMSMKDRSSDEMAQWIRRVSAAGGKKPSIPDYALDMHTRRGSEMGRGRRHFFDVAAHVFPELPDRDLTYRDRLLELMDEREG